MPLSSSAPNDSNGSSSNEADRSGLFDSTPWSQVLAAGGSAIGSRRSAFEQLCQAYWPPLFVYIQRRVRDTHLAQDVIQSFFTRLLSGQCLKQADPARGRFRTFLIQALDWHLANEFREGRTIKRGGDVNFFSLDFSTHQSTMIDDGSLTADQVFEREWALALLNLTIQRLQAEQISQQKGDHFDVLKNFLTGEVPAGGYASVCEGLGLSEANARMAVSRLRARYRELLREEILKTVASSQDVDDEIRHLFRALSAR